MGLASIQNNIDLVLNNITFDCDTSELGDELSEEVELPNGKLIYAEFIVHGELITEADLNTESVIDGRLEVTHITIGDDVLLTYDELRTIENKA